jgi:hypothetical protein
MKRYTSERKRREQRQGREEQDHPPPRGQESVGQDSGANGTGRDYGQIQWLEQQRQQSGRRAYCDCRQCPAPIVGPPV